jgi:tetratricopeptide (TPR) repeat protein
MKCTSKSGAGVLVLLSIFAFQGCTKLKARDSLNKGVRAFRDAKYETAVEHFKSAVDLDPELLNAHLYLATAYAAQYVPGGESPENKTLGQEAIKAFETVLQKDPKNLGSVKGIAGIYFQMKQLEKAKEFHVKAAELEPTNPDPYYSVGNINWLLCYDKSNPLPPAKKAELVEEGLKYLNKAIEIDPNYYNAYFYMNLLYRQKAQVIVDEIVEKNPKLKDQFTMAALDPKSIDPLVKKNAPDHYSDYQSDFKKADELFEKAMTIKKEVEAKAETKGNIDPNK